MSESRPVLKHREEFENILAHYHISEHARTILAKTPFVVLSGVAGSGRNTVINYLVDQFNYGFIVSDTTRPPKFRDGKMEQDGVNYYFRDEEALLQDLRNGEFVEAELIHNQQVSGTSIREVERIIATGKVPIHDYEFGGANAIAEAKSDVTIIAVVPPSYDEWIRRLSNREEMHHDELIDRLVTARTVLENMLAKPYFKFVINDNVVHSGAAIRQLVEHPDETAENEHGRTIAHEILQKVNEVLATEAR